MPTVIDRPPADFAVAVEEVRKTALRGEIITEPMPAPKRIAPYSYALSGDVVVKNEELATGRFILLYDPAGQDAWGGQFRCVTYARAEVEKEMATDPMLPDVGWSWLQDALAARSAEHGPVSGSITVVRSEGYGELAESGTSAQIEVRASWTPQSEKGAHIAAWADLLAYLAGLPPVEEDVVSLSNRRGRR